MANYLNAFFMSTETKFEVQRTNNFRVIIDASKIVAGVAANIITLAIDSVDIPELSNDPINLDYGNSDVKVAGKAALGDSSIAVKDFIEPNIEKILWYWRLLVYNPQTGKVGWAKNYKKNIDLAQFGPNGEVVRTWKCMGVWPTNLSLGTLDYSSADKKQCTMNLSIDNTWPVYGVTTPGKIGTTDGFSTSGSIGNTGITYS